MTTYVVGVIRKGPNWGMGTPSEQQRMQEGHMANIRKMGDTGKLITAGPIENSDLRGLFIFGVSSTEEARALVNEDPAVAARRLTVDLYQWYAPEGLRVGSQTGSQQDRWRQQVITIVSQIQRADYEGDRIALKRLHGELTLPPGDKRLASRVFYWRGFALWRRAINGFNDPVPPAELEDDFNGAISEFIDSLAQDPAFVESKIAAASCYGNLIYLNRKEPARVAELIGHSSPLLKEAMAADPDNPRLLWVLGPIRWNSPPARGGGQDKAFELYDRGLDAIHKKPVAADPLEPSWGEPELLMARAWSNLNKTTPDPRAAEKDAEAALQLVPYWHYVRDILTPQIQEAKKKSQ